MMCGYGAAFWSGGWNMMFPMFLIPLGMLFGFVALVILAWALLRSLTSRTPSLASTTATLELSATEILRQRYARGQIDSSRRVDDAAQLPGR